MALRFINIEKYSNDVLVFPAFSLTIEAGSAAAIYSNVTIREQLMSILLGKTGCSAGEIEMAKNAEAGFLFLEPGLYERLSVTEMLNFIRQLHSSKEETETVLRMLQLESKRKTKIRSLSYSEKKRVQLACLLIQNPDVYVMEEADQNLDTESKRIFLNVIAELKNRQKSILLLTGNLESAVVAANAVYRLDDRGLQPLQTEPAEETEPEIQEEAAAEESAEKQVQPIRFEKIPTKVNEKIVLFDPPEIDYIESSEGQSLVHIKGEAFPSFFTLSELEERLLPLGFFRCHRSYIVNLQKVREVITWTKNSYSLVLDDARKSTIPLSKGKMGDLKGMIGLK